MCYRKDFYIEENIFGYTGELLKNPTVYFLAIAENALEFGRITQVHQRADNVGRNEVRQAKDYAVFNYRDRAQEFYKGRFRHKSRNLFTRVKDVHTKRILADAINKYRHQKAKS